MSGVAPDSDRVEAALRRWLGAHGDASYDPYDGVTATFPWSLACRHHLTARVLMQLVKRSPVNVRPLLGIRKHVQAKSLSDQASAALLRRRLGTDADAGATARVYLERLRAAATAERSGLGWGMSTRYASRFIDARAGEPNAFWTIAAATAFLEAYELEGREDDLQVARRAIECIRSDLGIVDAGPEGVWFRYFAAHDAIIYNVTAMGGALLRRAAHHTGERDLAELGARALSFVVRRQNVDGSWYYAPGESGRWVDGFHSAYVLESLLEATLLEHDAALEAALHRGVAFYVERMFTPEGVPRYSAASTPPFEVQNCAQAIQTLAKLVWLDGALLAQAERVASAVIQGLYRETRGGPQSEGYFVMSRGRWFVNGLPAVRWGEAPMLLALSRLQAARRGLRPSWERARVAN